MEKRVKDFKSISGKLTVQRTRLKSGVAVEENVVDEPIEVTPFETATATVSVKAGATVNLGNYESGRIDVMVSVPCYVEEIEEVFPQVKKFVDDRMTEEYRELKNSVPK